MREETKIDLRWLALLALGMTLVLGSALLVPVARGATPANNPYPPHKPAFWAWQNRTDLPTNLGEPKEWDNAASAQGWPVGRYPRQRSIAVFEAGVWGAPATGHVAVVEQVNEDGSFLASEMSDKDCRFDSSTCGRVHKTVYPIMPGMSFIYTLKDTRTTWAFASGGSGWTPGDLGEGYMGGPGWYYPLADQRDPPGGLGGLVAEPDHPRRLHAAAVDAEDSAAAQLDQLVLVEDLDLQTRRRTDLERDLGHPDRRQRAGRAVREIAAQGARGGDHPAAFDARGGLVGIVVPGDDQERFQGRLLGVAADEVPPAGEQHALRDGLREGRDRDRRLPGGNFDREPLVPRNGAGEVGSQVTDERAVELVRRTDAHGNADRTVRRGPDQRLTTIRREAGRCEPGGVDAELRGGLHADRHRNRERVRVGHRLLQAADADRRPPARRRDRVEVVWGCVHEISSGRRDPAPGLRSRPTMRALISSAEPRRALPHGPSSGSSG
jgi:surface antigen